MDEMKEAAMYEVAKAAWAKLTPEKNAEEHEEYKALDEGKKKTFKHIMDLVCNGYMKSDDYKKGDKKLEGYKWCCETLDYCAFYKQTWFYLACGGALLLILIIIIVVIVCCCCKKRGGGGKDGIESDSKSDDTQSED